MENGTVVSIRVKNPLWERRKAYAYPIPEYQTYTGTVLPSPSWVGSDKICISTGNDRFAFRVIDRVRIEGFEEAREKPEDSVWTIEGAKGKTYIVAFSRGFWSCNCTGFGYRRTCSHVVSAKALKSQGNSCESTNLLKSQGNKNLQKSEDSCCLKSPNGVQSKSKVNRGNLAPLYNEKVKKMAKVTKTSKVIEIMTKNADRPMDEVSRIIETQLPCKEGYGRTWYRWAVKEGVAPGKLEGATRTAKAKAPKAKPDHKAKIEKSIDEIAKIKAKNLATMKSVSSKHKKYNQIARAEGPGVENFDADEARAEVANLYAELDSFKAPSKLSRDDVKALV